MKILVIIWLSLLGISVIFPGNYERMLSQNKTQDISEEEIPMSDFDKAVELIKKYETLHQPRHWPLVGYGHKVLPGENFSRTKAMSPEAAEELLRKDLLKNCAVFRSFGADSLLLGVLAYNIGSGAALKSSVAKKLKDGDRDIYDIYVSYSKYRGKTHNQLKKRRIEEFETLFIKENDKRDDSETLMGEEILIHTSETI